MINFSLKSDCIKVTCDDISELPDLSPLVPFHFNRKRDTYYFSLRKFAQVLEVFDKAPEQLHGEARETYMRVADQKHIYDQIRAGTWPIQGEFRVNEHLTLMPHQTMALQIAKVYDRFAFFYDTRTGKTPTMLSVIYDDIVRNQNSDHKWLVIAPLILLEEAWNADRERFIPEIDAVVCYDKSKDRRIKKIQSDASIYIINTESFIRYREYLDEKHFDGVILDESSSLKNKSSKFAKSFVDFSRTVKRCYLLSGTPAPNGAWEYYCQIRAIDYYGIHQSYTQFKQAYFNDISRDVHYERLVLRPDCKDKLEKLIEQYAVYMDKQDVLDTMPQTFTPLGIDMPQNLWAAYTEMANELYAEVDDAEILADSAAVKANKLNQITSGFLLDTEEGKAHDISDYRYVALANLLDTIGDDQAIIWANYRHEFERLAQMIEKRDGTCAAVYGAVSTEGKHQAIADFKSGKVQYLLANPASADKGLTLTNCHICVYFSLNWSYELYKQSTDRIYGDRSIQPRECRYYILLARNTIDEDIYFDVLSGKKDASHALLDHLKAVNR